MAYIKVKNNKIVEEEFPQEYKTPIKGGYVINKTTEFLRAEGWLPLLQDKPQFDSATQYLRFSHYNILHDRVLKVYEIEEKPSRVIEEPELVDVVYMEEEYKYEDEELEDVQTIEHEEDVLYH